MISAIVLSKNSEKTLNATLKSLTWCSEIILIDDGSTDKTIDIAQKYNAKIYRRNLGDDFSKQRQAAVGYAKDEWLLYIDSDEVVPPALKNEIISSIENKEIYAYKMHRYDRFHDKLLKHGELSAWNQIRLMKKNSGLWKGKVHEQWHTSDKVGELKEYIEHYAHSTVSSFLTVVNYYSTLRANELAEKGVKSNLIIIAIYPFSKFIVNYIFRFGFLDGTEGMIYALMMSFHSFLVRSKLYMLNHTSK